MTTGRVLQFDQARGYGFVAADDGGEDVFLHASVFDDDSGVLVPGVKVQFQVMAGDRGRKAFAVHLAADEIDPEDQSARQVPAALPPAVQAPLLQRPAAPSAQVPPTMALPVPDEEQMCDVLSPPEFRQEFTEMLLNTNPELTGQQIVQVRQGVLEFAKKHGWIDG